MSYTVTTSLSLGTSQTGLTLASQLFDTDGSNVGSEISSGFVEIGQGNYIWTYAFTEGFQGGVKFYDISDSSVILGITSINPEDFERINDIVSDLESLQSSVDDIQSVIDEVTVTPKEITIEVPHLTTSDTNIDVTTGSSVSSRNIDVTTGSSVSSQNIDVTRGSSVSSRSIEVRTGVR